MIKKLLLLTLFFSCAYSQSPQAFPFIKIGQYIIHDSTGIPRTPGSDSGIVFWRGKLGLFVKSWDGSVIRLDSAGSGTGGAGGGTLDTIRQGFGITATRINDSVYTIAVDSTVIATLGGSTSAIFDLDDLGDIMPSIAGTTDELFELDSEGWIRPKL